MVSVLTGSNALLLQQTLNMLLGDFVSEVGDIGVEKLDGEEASYDRMREALESMPFLASKKLVVLRAPSANKEFVEKSADLLSNAPDTTDVVIVEPKLDKRLAYYKWLKKHAELQEFNELDDQSLAKWLVERAKDRGGTLSLGDARYLIDRIGVNQQLAGNELDKLLNYDSKVTRQTIDLMTDLTPQSTIFELLDAALSGNRKRALGLYEEQRAQKVEPQQIMALLGWQLHVLAVVKSAGERDAGVIAKEAKLNPFVVRKTQGLARQMSMTHVKKLIHDALVLDIRLKSEPIDADNAVMQLLLNIS